MSRSSRVVVLCEDKRTQQFIRSFLRKLAYAKHEIRVSKIPAGSAEQRVREQYPHEVVALQRSRFPDQLLITVIDADSFTVDQRLGQIHASLTARSVAMPIPHDRISLLVPRRNIETWIRVLCGQPSDEDTNYKPLPGGTRDQHLRSQVRQAGESFYEVTRNHAPPPSPTVDSLDRAIPEAHKIPRARA
jgi:hypothetical protein